MGVLIPCCFPCAQLYGRHLCSGICAASSPLSLHSGAAGGVTILGPNVSVLQRCFRALVVPFCRSGALLLHVLPANGELV